MNATQRKQISRLQTSRNHWKTKAKERNYELRKSKQRIKELTQSRNLWRTRYEEINDRCESKRQKTQLSDESIYFLMVSLSLELNLICNVSFRAIPKVLRLLNHYLPDLGISMSLNVPHFSSVINWSLRLGYFLTLRQLHPMTKKWICIMDHTIQVGCKKAFVVLKVPVECFVAHRALQLTDVEVLYLKVQEKWNGNEVFSSLSYLFNITGNPSQVVVDGGPDLKKGLRLINESMISPIKITIDMTHLLANLLRKKYDNHPPFNEFMAKLAITKQKLQQTPYSYLIPKKERSKSRFLNLPALTQWYQNLKRYLTHAWETSDLSQEEKEGLHQHFGWLASYKDLLEQLSLEMILFEDLQKLLKNQSLNELNYRQARTLVQQLNQPQMEQILLDHLKIEWEFAKTQPFRTLLTSDIIESLFGKYKYLIKPHSFSEINRSILILPAICQKIDLQLVKSAFKSTKQKDLNQWNRNEINQTLLAKRRKTIIPESKRSNTNKKIIPFPQIVSLKNDLQDDGQKTVRTLQATG